MDAISLTPQMMCDECDAFLGKPHKEGCSKHGRLVENADAVEKMASVEEVERQNPMVGIDRDTAELLLRSLIPPEVAEGEDAEKLKSLREGLETFVAAAKEVEGGSESK